MGSKAQSDVTPAQVGFVAIYNPSLGATDETMDDQIVYYASVIMDTSRSKRRKLRSRLITSLTQEERNERLRQIGLAQGMVEFGRSFSGERPVDTVETEKSRVIMHELEPGWWILASIDLTKIPAATGKQTSSAASAKGISEAGSAQDNFEYSSKDVKPAALLLQDLLRSHCLFLLHHDSSLSSLFVRAKRTRFIALLSRYWDRFLSTWNVMLHGNPTVNMFGGIKLAASGELGVGVGEEERGSGEREVLEGLVGRIEGLVDIVVSKFGTYDPNTPIPASSPNNPLAGLAQATDQWLGTGQEPGAEDGAIFLGTGAISRHSLRNITQWMEDIYSWGENAYGVHESSTSTRRAKPRKKRDAHVDEVASEPVVWPPPPVTELAKRSKPQAASANAPSPSQAQQDSSRAGTESTVPNPEQGGDHDGAHTYADYFKLGYGKYWSIGSSSTPKVGETSADSKAGNNNINPQPATAHNPPRPSASRRTSAEDDSIGRFIIGLMGDIEEHETSSDGEVSWPDDGDNNSRTMLRTLTVELEESEDRKRSESQTQRALGSHDTELAQDPVDRDCGRDEGQRTPSSAAAAAARPAAFNSQDRNKVEKMRVVIYVNRPFMFTFLFKLRTDSLAWDRLYKSLHYQLSPLRKHLLKSTTYRAAKPDVGASKGGAAGSANGDIYDLIWDPKALTVQSTIPTIPDPTSIAAAAVLAKELPMWSRAEAINTHTHMLNMYIATRGNQSELERTCKTSRGWWVFWSRILDRKGSTPTAQSPWGTISETTDDSVIHEEGSDSGDASDDTKRPFYPQPPEVSNEIFLLRKASDHPSNTGSAGPFRNVSASSSAGGWADGASRIAQGIGIDTRKYIEGLLSLNR
ncbi:hypothetical protein MGG_01348 [Pyricularia oryzae 70-15]|uniref:CCZ1/INTU/HSP4 first Longin domain-containing protein n=1 Tax=Pyricularia oryzae (strain 70-15 / ATCC MYA-4617 / FGSC 8958) TaxID=242507 RepID=G4MYP3_PYRO7|nr:uncharacterized protein MGG_01348 [Pyricularia oryzae 70-15]EHA54468.1 hypothetical protein MGG_01348 [Pyricularia oryzae 70-15]KAI7931773.1 hypothetical protein M9X92_000091 [Pyricularia oryzae]